MDDLLICPRCGGNMEIVTIEEDIDDEMESFYCTDCNYHFYSMTEDLTLDRYDDDPDSLWISPVG